MICYINTNYTCYMLEGYRTWLTPMHLGIKILQEVFAEEATKDENGFAKIMYAYLTMSERMTRKYEKSEFGITETVIDGKTYKINEKVILDKAFCELKHFQKVNFDKKMPKLLIVAPMAGHHATLLRSTVQELLPYCDVYITDWREASYVPKEAGNFDMGNFINYIIEFINFIGPNLHTLAVCQPTVP